METRKKDLERLATWHIAGRVVLIALMLVSISVSTFFGNQSEGRSNFLYLAISMAFVLSALSATWLRFRSATERFLLAQAAIDTTLITGVIYVTGGAISPFLFLYLPTVMLTAVALSRLAAFSIAAFSIVSYIALMTALRSGLLNPADGSSIVPLPSAGILLQTIGLTSAMFLVAVATHYLRSSLSSSYALIEEGKQALLLAQSTHSELRKELIEIEQQLNSHNEMAQVLAAGASVTEHHSPLPEFIGRSPVMEKVFTIINRVSKSDATVLVSGESGTGKELVARAIHKSSSRTKEIFVAVNCGAIPENLIESELFGHKKGAFTGAESDYIGLIRQSHRGTLFLDEIGELPLLMQTKLLRMIQERTVRPVGGSVEFPVDIRIIAATNRNLRKEVNEGRFREDLFYRLNVIGIHLPPLRERKEDIPLLIGSILRRFAKDGATPSLPPASMQLLTSYNYPGNVRELENILGRCLVMCGEAILPEHLPEVMRGVNSSHITEIRTVREELKFPVDLETVLAEVEQRYIEAALLEAGGRRKEAAQMLNINMRSLRYRLKKFNLESDSPEPETQGANYQNTVG